jgi:D-alanyl-D-alanine carboxypeptidase/D-alanyl-D-alanine-endopeptidase (penicillin-binding protein 4)
MGYWLQEALMRAGIEIRGKVHVTSSPVDRDKFHSLLIIPSPPLREIIEVTNKRSVNLFTEVLLKMTALHHSGKSSTAEGTRVVRDIFTERGLILDGFRMKDGSGLSRTNMVRTSHFAHILAYMSQTPLSQTYMESFSLCGSDEEPGWLKNFGRGTPVEMNARIKTGYIEAVRSHSGYVKSRSGRLITFSMMCNNFTSPTGPINDVHEKIIIALSEMP